MVEFFKCVLWLEAFTVIQVCMVMLIWAIVDKCRK